MTRQALAPFSAVTLAVLWTLSGCGCPPCPNVPYGAFSSDEAIQHVRCLATCWRADTVLEGVSSGQRESAGGDMAQAGLPPVHEDGRSGQWIVTFASATAKCGQKSFEHKTYTVQSDGTRATGGSCFPVAEGCEVGLPSAPPDSTIVVPRGRAQITTLESFDPSSATVLAENFHRCGIYQDQLVNRQQWQVWSTWTQVGELHEALVEFDARGNVTATRGPCLFGDRRCLGQ